MEEDIKIVEEHIKELEEEKVLYGGFLSRKQAIEKLLKAYKEKSTEHKIMKRILVENGLWEKLLNDGEFINYLKEE